MSISILIVDDHAMLRQLLKRHLKSQPDFTVVGDAEDALEGIAKAEALRPEVILMDVSMPGMDGIEATRIIHERLPETKILILTLYASSENAMRARLSGAVGYLLKDSADEELIDAIRAVVNGKHYFCSEVAASLPPL